MECAILTGSRDQSVLLAAARYRALHLPKPFNDQAIETLDALIASQRRRLKLHVDPSPKTKHTVGEADANDSPVHKKNNEVSRWLEKSAWKWCTARGLSKRETEIVSLSLSRSLSREAVASELGVSVNTVRSHIGRLLHTTGYGSLEEIRRVILEELTK